MRSLLCSLALVAVAAAEPHLVLTPDRVSAPVGEAIVVSVAVADAPAFACYGASLVMPSSGIAIAKQEAEATPIWVQDSRLNLIPAVRFGGYAMTDRAAGTWELGRITLRATAPGTYVVRAPAFSATEPFGGLLLPLGSSQRIVAQAAQLTLTITAGAAPLRVVTLRQPAGHEWVILAPLDAVAGPEIDDPQWFRLLPWQPALFRPDTVPTANQ